MAKLLEKTIENACVKFHKKRFGKDSVVKLNGMGKRSHPDRMFLGNGRVLFIEFKRLGEEPTPLQLQLHKQWKKLGFKVHVVDDADHGKELLNIYFGKPRGERDDLKYPIPEEFALTIARLRRPR